MTTNNDPCFGIFTTGYAGIVSELLLISFLFHSKIRRYILFLTSAILSFKSVNPYAIMQMGFDYETNF